MSYVVSGSGTSVVKGLNGDPNHEIDLDIVQTNILAEIRQKQDIGVIALSGELEKSRKVFYSDAMIYTVLDKLLALGIVAKTVEPVEIESTKMNRVRWRLSDNFLNAMKG